MLTAFHGAHWALSAQSVPRNAVDLGHPILLNVLRNFYSNIIKTIQNWTKVKADDRFERESVNRSVYKDTDSRFRLLRKRYLIKAPICLN